MSGMLDEYSVDDQRVKLASPSDVDSELERWLADA